MGSTISHVGHLGSGHALKALNNYVSAAGLVAACEALRVAEAFGIDGQVAIDVFNSSTGRNNTTEKKLAQYVLNQAYNSGFSIGLMHKDLVTAVNLAEQVHLALPLGHSLSRIWADAESELGASADHTAIAKLVRKKWESGEGHRENRRIERQLSG
ncbi:NAD-binding protein [Ensifer sp. ENS05]|uniref:NAD-binding protein n=1 Tax=Ensifer sp. ENS05 TaxID=2769277 RepID=UPI001FEEF149|nr:NAD-binding protein [Ensifer sp. ENS05]